MDFVSLIFFLMLYYLRPQEWVSAFSALRPVQLLSFLAVWGLVQQKKLHPRNLLRTPCDWLIFLYFVWTLICANPFMHTLVGIEAVLLFYFVAVLSLDSIARQNKFLMWWCYFMLVISALAIASEYGFDPLGGYDITQWAMKGRLILNLSVFDNPNALAHSVVPAIPLLYYLFFWRRLFMRASLLLLAIPVYCIFLTQSKGAFLCAFATVLATLTFGRSKIMQVIILVLAIGIGYGALYKLPRMNELNHARADPAIQGRIAALTYGLQLMRTQTFGIGLGNFEDMFLHHGPLEKIPYIRIIPAHKIPGNEGSWLYVNEKRIHRVKYVHFSKATHGAYNQNGAELGYVGLFLFVGILYCCVRTLLLVKSKNDDEERIRRALFAMVVAYAVSSWMVDFCYRPTFFLMVAAVSAFHRHLLRKQAEEHRLADDAPAAPALPWLRPRPLGLPIPGISMPIPGIAMACANPEAAVATAAINPGTGLAPLPYAGVSGSGNRSLPQRKTSFVETIRKKFIWTRLGLLDLIIMLALTYAAIRYWEHLIITM